MTERTQDSAACVIRDGQGRVLLVRQTYGHRKWSLPGGKVEPGESAWSAIVRECREELNITIEPALRGLYFLAHRNAYIFVFAPEAVAGIPTPDGHEIDAAAYFPTDQLPTPISTFTLERIRDLIAHPHGVTMKVQHLADYGMVSGE